MKSLNRKTVPLVTRKHKEGRKSLGSCSSFQCHLPHGLMTSYSTSLLKRIYSSQCPTLRTKTLTAWVFPGCLGSKLYQTGNSEGVCHTVRASKEIPPLLIFCCLTFMAPLDLLKPLAKHNFSLYQLTISGT